MSMVEIHEKGERVRRINLTSVEELARGYEKVLFKRKNLQDRNHVEYSVKILREMKKLNKDQLEYLVCYIVGFSGRLSDLWQSTLDEPEKHLEFVKKYKRLKGILKKANKTIENNIITKHEELATKRKKARHFYNKRNEDSY